MGWLFPDNSGKEIVKSKRAVREKEIERVSSLVTSSAEDAEILGSTASQIVQSIKVGRWTAKRVMEAYIIRAVAAHKATNCLTEIMFDQALIEAEQLDRDYIRTKTLKGPLHGLPISFKDQYDVTGFDSTIGFTQWANNAAVKDAQLVAQVKAAGGIIIAKTNVPQTMLSFECANPLWGITTNPWSSKHTCGGSSGGEAALLAADGAALGFGSDIGGSLRIPTSYCGIYSIKPGWGRISTEGARSPNSGFKSIPSVCGPMTRSVEDVKLACQLLFAAGGSNNAQALPPVPYRPVKLGHTLRFGYYLTDGCFMTSPACQRAVLETVSALRKEGHECIEFVPPNVKEALAIFAGLTSADGYHTILSHLGPDSKEKSLFLVTLGPTLPGFVRWLAAKAVLAIKGDEVFVQGLSSSRIKTVGEHWKGNKDREEFNKMWYSEVWDKYGFDGIIAPVQASPALPHGATMTLSPLALATFLYNIVDSPVGIVPVTRVDPARDALTEEWKKAPGHGSVLIEDNLYGGSSAPYNPVEMAGLPVGVQIVGRAWEEEKVIEMMDVVDKALGKREFGPGTWQPR